MIGSGIIEGKLQEFFERGSIVDLSFQFRVGIDVKPLLEKQAFHKEDRRIRFVSLCAFTDRIGSQEEFFDSGPIHDGIDLLHSFDSAVLFDRREKRDVSEGEVGLHFFEAHSSSREMNLKKIWHKNH